MTAATELIKELRARTGIGITDAKKALDETDGNIEKAIVWLKKHGALKAHKKSDRVTKEGRIHAYIHANGKIGALIELQCETDFVAKNEEFKTLAHDIAMHVTAADPLYLSEDDIPEDVLKKEEEIQRARLKGEGKNDTIIEKALPGSKKRYIGEVCLLKQPFIKDESITVAELIHQKISMLGENIKISRFMRFHL